MADLTQLIAEVIVKDSASAAADRVAGAVQQMGDKVVASTRSLDAQAKSFERLKAAADPVYASQQRIANVQAQLQKATQLGVASQEESAALLARVVANTTQAEVGFGRFTRAIEHSGIALGAMAVGLGSTERGIHSLFHTVGLLAFSFGNEWIIAIGAVIIGLTALAEHLGLFRDRADEGFRKTDDFKAALSRAGGETHLYNEALRESNDLMQTAAERSAALTRAKEKEAAATASAALQVTQHSAAIAEFNLRSLTEQTPLGGVAASPKSPQAKAAAAEVLDLENRLEIIRRLNELNEHDRLHRIELHRKVIAAEQTRDAEIAAQMDRDRAAANDRAFKIEVEQARKLTEQHKKDAAEALRDAKHRLEVETELVNAQEKQFRSAQTAANIRGSRLAGAQSGIGSSLQAEIDQNKDLIAALSQGADAYQREGIYLNILNRYRAIGLPLIGDEKDKAMALADELTKQQETLQSLQAANQDMNSSLSTLTQGFMDAARGSANWQNITLAAINAVSDAIIKMAQLNSGGQGGIGGLLSGILGLIPSLFGGGMGQSGFGGQAGRAGFATGADFIVGGSGAGDTTPVSFMATPGERVRVTPRGQSENGGLTVNINAPGADAAQLRQVVIAVRELHRNFEKRTVSAMTDAKRRGGDVSQIFG